MDTVYNLWYLCPDAVTWLRTFIDLYYLLFVTYTYLERGEEKWSLLSQSWGSTNAYSWMNSDSIKFWIQ